MSNIKMKYIFKNFIQSNFDLEDKINQVGIPLNGIYNKDNLPLSLKDGNYILNLDSVEGDGTHWCAFFKNNNNIYYFDSYGMPPPVLPMKIFKGENCKVFYNDKIIQHLNTSSCGYWVIAFFCFLHRVEQGETTLNMLDHYQEFLNLFDDKNQVLNEITLKKFLLPF